MTESITEVLSELVVLDVHKPNGGFRITKNQMVILDGHKPSGGFWMTTNQLVVLDDYKPLVDSGLI